jgi:hypothetical protein
VKGWPSVARSLVLSALCAAPAVGCAAASNGGSSAITGGGAATGSGGVSYGSGGSIYSGTGGSTGGCVTDTCVPPLTAAVAWGVEIDPMSSAPASASPYAHTQFASRNLAADASFMVKTASTVTIVFSPATNGGPVPSNANAILTVSPIVPGRPDLVYQGAAVAAGGTTTAMLLVPQDAFNTPATLSLIPLPPADQQTPVYPFSVMVSANIAVAFPAGDLLTSGQLLDSLQNQPPATFVAKVFQNGVQVSNAPLTQADGTFQLQIPAAATASPLTLELLPTSSDPWVTSAPFTLMAGNRLGTITLPAYTHANSFSVAVTNGTTGLAAIFVRAQTSFGATAGSGTLTGTAQYAAAGTTDSAGNVSLQLLPGSTYAIAATPPAGSLYASQCVPMVKTVTGGGPTGSSAPNVNTIVATLRPVLTGKVRTASLSPLSSVSVTATGTPDASPPCAAPAPTTVSATTDATGTFQLPLDPGTYQIDYDPPAGSAAPRATEWGVSVSGAAPVQHDLTLPQGALVTGSVIGSQREALAGAVVRFFQPRCTGPADCLGPNRIAPLLIGKALTDSQGRFRMVVADPAVR